MLGAGVPHTDLMLRTLDGGGVCICEFFVRVFLWSSHNALSIPFLGQVSFAQCDQVYFIARCILILLVGCACSVWREVLIAHVPQLGSAMLYSNVSSENMPGTSVISQCFGSL